MIAIVSNINAASVCGITIASGRWNSQSRAAFDSNSVCCKGKYSLKTVWFVVPMEVLTRSVHFSFTISIDNHMSLYM